MSSERDFNAANYDGNAMSLWFKKLLNDKCVDDGKATWIGQEFIKQFSERSFSDVFLRLENLKLPIDKIYDMLQKENEIVAYMEKPVDFDNLTMDELPCLECDEASEKIKELQKIQDMQRSVIDSNTKLLEDFEKYLENDIPRLVEETIINFKNDDETLYHSETLDQIDVQHKDLFLRTNENLIDTIRKATDTIITDECLKHSQEINKLQDKIIELQTVVDKNARQNEMILGKLKKYKINCFKLKNEKEKLENLLLNQHREMPLQKVNEDLKNGKFFVELKAKNERFINSIRNISYNENIGDC